MIGIVILFILKLFEGSLKQSGKNVSYYTMGLKVLKWITGNKYPVELW